MKRQVRRGTFETNSSSTHAICITKSEYRHNLFSHIDFEIGEFGWENDKLIELFKDWNIYYSDGETHNDVN